MAHHVVAHVPAAEVRSRASKALIGAVVADAAALGLHWVYDQAAVAAAAAAAGGEPAFAPHATAWHAKRAIGDVTMLGAATMVAARALVDKKAWSRSAFVARYYAEFGPGGSYTGYVDSATKGA